MGCTFERKYRALAAMITYRYFRLFIYIIVSIKNIIRYLYILILNSNVNNNMYHFYIFIMPVCTYAFFEIP